MDDVLKEKILRALPADICRTMQSQMYLLNADDVAELADAHFDQQGRQLNSTAGNAEINAVVEKTDDENSINAINRRPNNGRNRGGYANAPSTTRTNAPPRSGPAAASSAPHPQGNAGRQTQASTPGAEKLCTFHRRYGDQARTCQTGCSLFDAFMANKRSGNGRGGRQ